MYANLIVNGHNKELDKLFTYEIDKEIKIGDRVMVTFGNFYSFVDALVYEVFDDLKDCNFKIKKVNIVLPKKYSLTECQLFIIKNLRTRYAFTYLEAYKSVISSQEKIVYTDKYEICEEFMNFKKGEVYKKTQINKLLTKKKLDKLIKEKKIILNREFKVKDESTKLSEIIISLVKKEDETKILDELSSKKQKIIMKHIFGVQKQDLKEVLSATSANRSHLKSLVSKNLIEIKTDISSKFDISDKKLKANYIMDLPLSDEQKLIFNDLHQKDIYRTLIQGVTGSGKTRLYMELAKVQIEKGKQVLILLPEISLTPQIIGVFAENLKCEIVLIHSLISQKERINAFDRIRNEKAKIIIGARSAIFAPFKNLGLIILDEVHEDSYISDSYFRYDAREIAFDISLKMNISLIYGSATPSLKIINLANSGYISRYFLNKRILNASLPSIHIVELKEDDLNNVSNELIEAMNYTFSKNEQVILFNNRKGFDNYLECQKCHHILKCVNCNISLRTHNMGKKLLCHYCNYYRDCDKFCEKCFAPYNFESGRGQGVEKYMNFFEMQFPEKKFALIDATNIKNQQKLVEIFKNFKNKEIDALIGTQIIAKGLDFKDVTLIGILDADQSIYQPQYDALERAYQLFSQVAGRAGRSQKKGNVIVQTKNKNEKIFNYLQNNDFESFILDELEYRKNNNYPPYTLFYAINISSENLENSYFVAKQIENKLRNICFLIFKDEYLQINKVLKDNFSKIKNRFYYNISMKFDKKIQNKIINILYNLVVIDKYKFKREDVRFFINFNFINDNI